MFGHDESDDRPESGREETVAERHEELGHERVEKREREETMSGHDADDGGDDELRVASDQVDKVAVGGKTEYGHKVDNTCELIISVRYK